MPTSTIVYHDESERIILEQAITYLGQLRRVAMDAPSGTVLDACETLALHQGRVLLRSTSAAALHGRIAEAEQEGGPPAPAPKRTPATPKARTRGRS